MFDELPFHLVGASHHTAGVGLRERLALGAAGIAALLEQEAAAGRAVVPLFTCNRAEVYAWGEAPAWFGSAVPETALVRLSGTEAVRHLFSVTAGLDSQIVGETEIQQQVRRAFDAARAAGATTRELDTIFSAALAAGRRVRRDTALGRHPVSVSAAAIRLAQAEWGATLAGRRVLVLGAGEAAEGVLRALHHAGADHVTVVNRDPVRAHTVAVAWGVNDVRPWDALEAVLADADLVVAATAAQQPILSADMLAAAGRSGLIVVDLCVPRNVEPAVRELPGIRLLDLDDLQARHCPVTGGVSLVLREAEQLLDDELNRLSATFRARAAAPRLAELHRLGARLAAEEAEWALDQLGPVGERERDVVRQMAERLVRRVMYPLSRAVRDGATAEAEARVAEG